MTYHFQEVTTWLLEPSLAKSLSVDVDLGEALSDEAAPAALAEVNELLGKCSKDSIRSSESTAFHANSSQAVRQCDWDLTLGNSSVFLAALKGAANVSKSSQPINDEVMTLFLKGLGCLSLDNHVRRSCQAIEKMMQLFQLNQDITGDTCMKELCQRLPQFLKGHDGKFGHELAVIKQNPSAMALLGAYEVSQLMLDSVPDLSVIEAAEPGAPEPEPEPVPEVDASKRPPAFSAKQVGVASGFFTAVSVFSALFFTGQSLIGGVVVGALAISATVMTAGVFALAAGIVVGVAAGLAKFYMHSYSQSAFPAAPIAAVGRGTANPAPTHTHTPETAPGPAPEPEPVLEAGGAAGFVPISTARSDSAPTHTPETAPEASPGALSLRRSLLVTQV